MDTSLGGKQASTFKTFPEFSKLTIQDRRKYELLIKDFPAISDISFPMLMLWWNWLDSCAVSILNGNLVIAYWFPGEDRYSGLSILGTNKIEESICTIFDHLRETGEPVRLVHVPEFVLSTVEYPELFTPKAERAFDEYIYPTARFYPLEQTTRLRKRRTKRFMNTYDEERIVVKSLDLSQKENQQLLLENAEAWQKKGILRLNNIAKNEAEAIKFSIKHADVIGIENMCIFIDDELQAFSLHQILPEKVYAIGLHVRIKPDVPRMFDYVLYCFAHQLHDKGVMHINLKYDLGVLPMRMFKLALGPENYFRKYTIEPAE